MKQKLFRKEFEVPTRHKVLIRAIVWGIPILGLCISILWGTNITDIAKRYMEDPFPPSERLRLEDLETDLEMIQMQMGNPKEFVILPEGDISERLDRVQEGVEEVYRSNGYPQYIFSSDLRDGLSFGTMSDREPIKSKQSVSLHVF